MSICSMTSGSGAPATVSSNGLEVADDEVDGFDVTVGKVLHVGRVVADGEDAGVDDGMERLDASAEDFGEAGRVADFGNGNALVLEVFEGAATREDLVALSARNFAKRSMPSFYRR
jgi:hypothetical protein